MSTPTISTIAREAADCFTVRTREDGEQFTATRDGSPDWVTDIIHHAHGEFLPDDWRYDVIGSALEHIADADIETRYDADDLSGEFADGAVDTYNAARFKWLASNLQRAGYCDRAREDGLVADDADIIDRIGIGQYAEAEEIFALVLDALEARADELEEVEA